MDLRDQFRYLVRGYYGVKLMDEYGLKEYVLKDIENYIKDFISDNPIKNFDYYKEAENVNIEKSLKTKNISGYEEVTKRFDEVYKTTNLKVKKIL